MPLATAAAILLTDDHQKVLLTRRSVEPFKGLWCIPGGHIEEYEPARAAVIREVKEETGFDFDPVFFNYFDEVFPELRVHHVVLVFYGLVSGAPSFPPEEVAEARWFTFEEAVRQPLAFGHKQVLTAFVASLSG